MNLLLGALGIAAASCMLRFLVGFYKDEGGSASRSVTMYIVREQPVGVQKITGRRYGKLTILDGGVAARPCLSRGQYVIPIQSFILSKCPTQAGANYGKARVDSIRVSTGS